MSTPQRPATSAPFVRAALVAAAALATACVPDKLENTCSVDAECSLGLSCREGRCVCVSDASCEEGFVCNASGFCQRRIGCESSLECEPGFICDLATGICIERDKCTADVQCELGQICDETRLTCVPGCREVGDCPLGAVCECAGGEETCAVGSCKVGPCADNSFCRYGEVCQDDGPGTPKRCQKDERGPYCEPCTIAPGQNYCGEQPQNYCLVDTSKQFNAYFCGVDCSAGQACPWGFDCSDVLILTQDICGGGNQCPVLPVVECTADEECEREGKHCVSGRCECATNSDCPGGVCNPETKRCQSQCVGSEGGFGGFCTCLRDSDCPTETCDVGTGACSLSGKPCSLDDDCGQIYCVNQPDPLHPGESIGYCKIGQNCAPVEGVSCDQVRSGR